MCYQDRLSLPDRLYIEEGGGTVALGMLGTLSWGGVYVSTTCVSIFSGTWEVEVVSEQLNKLIYNLRF